MRNLKIFWMLAILALLAFGGCENKQKNASSGVFNDHTSGSMVSDDSNSPAVWPPPLQSGEALAPNSLAVNYLFDFDDSRSMGDWACDRSGYKIDVAKAAVAKFIEKISADANVGLSQLNDGEKIPLGIQNRDALAKAIAEIRASGGTPLRSSMEEAYLAMTAQGSRQLGYGEYHLVMVTDGEANSGEDPRGVVDFITRYSPIVIHTIGFCIGSEHSLNQPGVTYYAEANSPEQLAQGLAGVLAEAPKFDVSVFTSNE